MTRTKAEVLDELKALVEDKKEQAQQSADEGATEWKNFYTGKKDAYEQAIVLVESLEAK